ncbi:DNA primase family protein [Algimonas arctica]|nr:phage/plasmid primase, P4 family [Algimonas arctica]
MPFNEEIYLPAPNELELAALPLTEFGNTKRLLARYGDVLAYGPGDVWYCWSGKQWVGGERGRDSAMVLAQKTVEAMEDELAVLKKHLKNNDSLTKHEKAFCNVNRLAALEKWIAHSSGLVMLKRMVELSKRQPDQRNHRWDTDLDRINLQNGSLVFHSRDRADGKTGRSCEPAFYKHTPSDYMTKIAEVAYDPDAKAPLWEAHLERCLPDPEDRRFFQRYMGSCLTGRCDEQAFLILQGDGANGKSTTIRVLQDLLGDYGASVDVGAFLKGGGQAPGAATPQLARLEGPRMVVASEPEDGACFNEARLKTFTGGDRVVGRKLYKDLREFVPQLKLIIPCNKLPRIGGRSEATWRRVHVLEWTTSIPKEARDPRMKERLARESAGVLNWMIQGLIDYTEQGLAPPQNVRDAKSRYKGTASPVARWVEERLQTGLAEENMIFLKDLHENHEAWCARQTLSPLKIRAFGQALTKRGIPAERSGGDAVRKGVALKHPNGPNGPKGRKEPR